MKRYFLTALLTLSMNSIYLIAPISSIALSKLPTQTFNKNFDRGIYSFKPAQWDGLPSNHLTPGAKVTNVNQGNVKSTICSASYVKKNSPSSSFLNNLKAKQIKAGYFVDGLTDTKLYAEDHLIPIELGGSPASETENKESRLKFSKNSISEQITRQRCRSD